MSTTESHDSFIIKFSGSFAKPVLNLHILSVEKMKTSFTEQWDGNGEEKDKIRKGDFFKLTKEKKI